MNSTMKFGLIGFGILFLLIGIAIPATTTQTSTTCVDDIFGYGQNCAQTSYESPNLSKFPLIGVGIIMTLVGVVSFGSDSISTNSTDEYGSSEWTSSDQSASSPTSSDQPTSSEPAEKTLKQQIEEYEEKDSK